MRGLAGEVLASWVDSPLRFVRECLGARPDAWQEEVLLAAPRHQRIALKACKGPGKTTILSWLSWWFLTTRPHPKAVATSITEDNLRDNLWAEMAKWQGASRFLSSQFTWAAERISYNLAPETWFMSARTWPKTADPNKQADTLAGIHADHVLFVLDESGGIPSAVMATAEAGLANANAEGRTAMVLQAGNPTELSGPLYEACTRDRALWWVKEISGAPDDPQRAPRVSVQWASEQIRKYGRDNPWVLVNVFGQFPPGQSDTLMGLAEVTEASKRVAAAEALRGAARVMGVDVARFGDDRSVLARRIGVQAYHFQVWRNADTMRLASEVAREAEAWRADALIVDQTGVGAGVVDRLKQLGVSVLGVDAAQSPMGSQTQKCLNLRAEMWANLKDWVRAGGCLPDDSEVVTELAAPKYAYDRSGKLVLESKKDLKARGFPSPDKADALALTFALPVRPRQYETAFGRRQQQAQATDYNPVA